MTPSIFSLFPGRTASLNQIPAEWKSIPHAATSAIRPLKCFLGIVIFLIMGACWNSASACSMDQTNNVQDPADGVLTSCRPGGSFAVYICLTNQCWGYGITNWTLKGKTVDITWSWDTVNMIWAETINQADPNISGIPAVIGQQGNAFLIGTSGQAVSQTVQIQGTGYLQTYDPNTGITTITATGGGTSFTIKECGGCCGCNVNANDDFGGNRAPPLGTAGLLNYLGPVVSFNLGAFSYQQDAGTLLLSAQATSTNLYNPAALYVPYIRSNADSNVEVITNTSGVVLQVKSPQGLVNVALFNAYKYQLQFFYSTNIATKTNGLYGTNAAAFDTWTIANPNGATNNNVLTVSESATGQQYTYTSTNTNGVIQWQLTDSGGLENVWSWQVQNPTNSALTNIFSQSLFGTNVIQQTEKIFAVLSGKRLLMQQIDGIGTTTNIFTYSYNSSNWVQQVNYPNGNWEFFVYDSNGRVATNYSAYGTSLPPSGGNLPNSTSNPYKETDYYFNLQVTGDNVQLLSNLPRLEVVSIPDNAATMREVSRTYRSVPSPDEVDEYRCVTPGTTWDDPLNLLTVTVRYENQSDRNTYGQINWQILPDETATIYAYQANGSGLLTNIISQIGQPDNFTSPTTILNGTQSATALNSLGEVIFLETQAITNSSASFPLSEMSYSYSGGLLGEDYKSVDLANRTNAYQFACCGLSQITDPDGVVTLYSYDTLKRQVAISTLRGTNSVTATNILDAAGRVVVSQRIGSDNSVITVQQYQYDALGRVIRETNALNGVTTHTNVLSNNQVIVTNIYPDGGTLINTYFSDGRLQSLTGTAVQPVKYVYGAEQDGGGGPWREYKLTIKLDANGGTNEWVKTYVNGARRQYKAIYASGGSNPYSISYFNTLGQLTNQVDGDGVSTIYSYNSKGEQVLAVVDINQDYNIDYSGSDRITFTTNDVATDHGANTQRTQTYVWSTNGNASSNLISTFELSTDGLKTWSTTWNNGVAVTSSNVTVYAGGGNRYVTNAAPDNSYTVVAYLYGQLISGTSYDANNMQIGQTTYAYDAHGRQNIVADARTGTNMYYFNNADQINGMKSPAPVQVTTNFFDNLGRMIGTTLPDNTSVTNLFYPTGQPKLTYGSRMYPVGYSYDAQGRQKTMTNWSGFATLAGARVTTWNYDPYRGFLTSKAYDGNTAGPAYTYTAAGRLQTRLWARGTNTTYAYNTAGDLFSINYNDGATASLTNGYDRRGRQSAITNGSTVCTLTYNDPGNALTESYSGGPLGGVSITNGFDILLRRTNLATLNSTTPLLQTSYGYDAASRLQNVSDGTNSATYSYLANSPLVSQLTFKQNASTRMTTSKSYDNLNRLTFIGSSNATPAVLDSHGYTYNNANQRTSVTNADGTYWIYQYDNLGQVNSGVKYWSDNTVVAGQQFGYNFDTIGNRTSIQAGGDQNGANLRSATYTANNLNQYSSRTVPAYLNVLGTANSNATVSLNITPTYRKGTYYRDELTVTNSSAAVYLSVTNLAVLNNGTNADIVTNVAGNVFLPQTPENYTYDADGNLIQDGRWTYAWDGENRLMNMTSLNGGPSGSKLKLDFAYDYQGRRIQKIVSAWNGSAYVATSTNRLAFDGWNVIAILNSDLSLQASFIWGLDLTGSAQGAGSAGALLVIARQGTNLFASFDGNGNLTTLIDAALGTASAQYEYGPFGELIRATGPAATSNPFRWSTKYVDYETDLAYYGFRYYSQSLGRWLSRDLRAETAIEPNLYAYVGNSSIDLSDFLGLSWDVQDMGITRLYFQTQLDRQRLEGVTTDDSLDPGPHVSQANCPPGKVKFDDFTLHIHATEMFPGSLQRSLHRVYGFVYDIHGHPHDYSYIPADHENEHAKYNKEFYRQYAIAAAQKYDQCVCPDCENAFLDWLGVAKTVYGFERAVRNDLLDIKDYGDPDSIAKLQEHITLLQEARVVVVVKNRIMKATCDGCQ